MTIREATIEDAPAIVQLLLDLGYPQEDRSALQNRIRNHKQDTYCLLVAEDPAVVGFISMHWYNLFHSEGLMGRITALCVTASHRSTGIGSALLTAAERLLAMKGCNHVEVTTNFRRTRTHEFYRKQGYEEDSKRFHKLLRPD